MCRFFLSVGFALFLAASSLAQAANLPSHDVPGSHDHPMVSRFTGSVIAGYQSQDYAEVIFPMGLPKWSAPDHFLKSQHIEGKVTRIFYVAPQGKTGLEVYRNFESALTRSDFKVTYACHGKDGPHGCGGHDFADYLINPLLDPLRARNLMIDVLDVVNGNVRYLSAHLDRAEGNVDVSLLVSQSDRTPPGVLLQIVEAKPMATNQVTVDSKAMSQGLAKSGHIALYGIHFASDSATLQKGSYSTLEEMAKLMKAHPKLKVFIVGHTDNTGALPHNVALSQQRADAVVKALETRYHVHAGRLAAKGLASYAPVASNGDDAGRARNRRVELVEQ
jgi:OOP family OmpA-OmpF porin